MKTITFLLALVCVLVVIPTISMADTGTYVIQSQKVNLSAYNTTDVLIEYDVTFRVTGGNIPWVTIGLPNANYEIVGFGGAAKNAYPNNGGGWTGARLDLDKTYYSGDTFNFKVSALQKKLVKVSGNDATLSFTPVWWDNAVTEYLSVFILPAPGITEVKTSSEPTKYIDGGVLWEFNNVPRGGKRNVGVVMNASAFDTGSSNGPSTSPSTSDPGSDSVTSIFITFLIILPLAIVILGWVASLVSDSDEYESPTMSMSSGRSRIAPAKKNLVMKCPTDGETLKSRTVDGVKLDMCPKCGGTFFDDGEIQSLAKKDVSEDDLDKERKEATNEYELLKRIATASAVGISAGAALIALGLSVCPRCDGKMSKKKGLEEVKATVHYCSTCGGSWLERGEYSKIKDFFKKLKKEYDNGKKKPIGKDADDDRWFHWWMFYPIWSSHTISSSPSPSHGGGSFGGGGAGFGGGHSSCVHSSCACVSCACVACACACACAGGGAAGCAPKNRVDITKLRR